VEGGFVIERGLIDFAETQYIGNQPIKKVSQWFLGNNAYFAILKKS
jgi:hypothetical protein